ncbi:MAG: outer membrane protein assembly factor BamE [Comamonadaceae bacterium]|nr:MAG: outer membrane protein assembly factor BamE [Comamonadaceae bacterium]
MNNVIQRFFAPTLVLAALVSGCSSYVSRGIDERGQATEVIFPTVASDITLPEGTFPNLDNLRAVGPGMTKDQMYDLLGRPHFKEGLLGVREWDYLFNFRSGGSTTVCQYKVIYNSDYKVGSTHWKPAACAALLAPTRMPQQAPAAVAAPVQSYSLATDALFGFDSDVLHPEGQRKVKDLAKNLRDVRFERIGVVGHTDRLGTESYNLRLSERRAQAVRAVLVDAGLPASQIAVSGKGEVEPVVQCAQQARAALTECLAPNRRVDVTVDGTR